MVFRWLDAGLGSGFERFGVQGVGFRGFRPASEAMWVSEQGLAISTETGSFFRLIDSCITQLKA